MKWFKHQSDSYSNLKHQQIIAEYGLIGYGFYWVCLELVAQQGTNCRIKGDKNWKMVLQYLTRQKHEEMEKILASFATIGLIDKKGLENGDLYIPKMAEHSDEYTKRVRRVSEQGTDNVPLEENRIDKNRIEQSRRYLENIPKDHMKEFLDRFNATEKEIKSKAEDLKLYCERKGREYKNYKSFLLNALKRDFKERDGTAKGGKYAHLT